MPGYELGSRGIEFSWQLQNNGKKGIGCENNISCVILSGSETVIYPLPGYD
jgi:hypothetical protein